MPINIPRNRPPVAIRGASGSGQASVGSFSGKSVSIPQQRDAKQFIQVGDAGQSIQQRKPIPTPRSKHKIAQASGSTGFSGSSASKSAPTSPGSQSQSGITSMYDYVRREPQAEVTSMYDYVRQEPQDEVTSMYDYVRQEPQDEVPSTYDYVKHGSQATDGSTTQGHEGLPRTSSGSQSQAEVTSFYDYLGPESQSESDLSYDYVRHGDQTVGGAGSHPQEEELYAEVTEGQLRGVRISEAPAVPVSVREIASQAIDETSRLVDDATRYIGELEKDIIGIMERERLQEFSSGNIGNLSERVTNQHNLCIDSFAEKFAAQGKRLEELTQSKRLTGTLADNVHQNIGIIKAMKDKFSAMRNQLAAEAKKIGANSFNELDIEKPAQPRVLTELSGVRNKIGELRQSTDKVTKGLEQLKVGIRNMGKVNLSSKDIGKAVRPIMDDHKAALNKSLVELSHCEQSLNSVQKDFKNFLRSMSVTESTYTKALHSQQVGLAAACRQDVDRVLGELSGLENLYPQ